MAPSVEDSSRRLEMASWAASTARLSPEATPMPQGQQFPMDSFEEFMHQFGSGFSS